MNRENLRIDVSIIVATYNNEDTIKETLDSIIEQETNYNYEIVITDDSSSDKTLEILEKYNNELDIFKIFKNRENKGAGFARNYSIKKQQRSLFNVL